MHVPGPNEQHLGPILDAHLESRQHITAQRSAAQHGQTYIQSSTIRSDAALNSACHTMSVPCTTIITLSHAVGMVSTPHHRFHQDNSKRSSHLL